jgi:hypothetical protein
VVGVSICRREGWGMEGVLKIVIRTRRIVEIILMVWFLLFGV